MPGRDHGLLSLPLSSKGGEGNAIVADDYWARP